jgi:hypothetical protein
VGKGIRPGWDIEFTNTTDELHRVEVKGTTLRKMTDCNVTGNEWRAAVSHGPAFSLYLVTDVGGQNVPKLSKVENPAAQIKKQPELLEPTAFRLNLSGLATES